eukprot:TRINITY_DN10198_c0_g1_i4.p3 TRINITY_DN10198_c0_g1~~TRINITY_DN10198_c0_g1_i4.p3  ORF type:complete len:123 (+),score=31.24 TRINITY_DN10198_c0_g1_i4:96-464(+)
MCYRVLFFFFFFFNDTATTEIYTLHIVGSVRCVQETGTQGSANVGQETVNTFSKNNITTTKAQESNIQKMQKKKKTKMKLILIFLIIMIKYVLQLLSYAHAFTYIIDKGNTFYLLFFVCLID